MNILSFEEIAEQINTNNTDYLKAVLVDGYDDPDCNRDTCIEFVTGEHGTACYDITAYRVFEFMCADYNCYKDSKYRNDNNVTAAMVERYAQQLHDMQ